MPHTLSIHLLRVGWEMSQELVLGCRWDSEDYNKYGRAQTENQSEEQCSNTNESTFVLVIKDKHNLHHMIKNIVRAIKAQCNSAKHKTKSERGTERERKILMDPCRTAKRLLTGDATAQQNNRTFGSGVNGQKENVQKGTVEVITDLFQGKTDRQIVA